MTNHIADKSLLITGAGNGFGRLTAERAAALGGRVTCVDVDAVAAEATATAIRAQGGSAIAVAADVRQAEQMRAAVDQAVKAFGSIDVLVNNAGIMPLAFMADHEFALEAWHRCIDINFKGVINGTIAARVVPSLIAALRRARPTRGGASLQRRGARSPCARRGRRRDVTAR